MLNIKMPKTVLYILDKLNKVGFEAYIVGGCVRDSLMNRIPNDWDITTSALPCQILNVFKEEKTIDIGKKFGTIIVIKNSMHIEITTFRAESEYKDSRRPQVIEFKKDILEDLARRDFTINSISYHPKIGLIDPFEGKNDISLGVIKTVGRPHERFSEDALRILRAIRFSTQLNFYIEKNTYEAIIDSKEKLENISKERIRDEFFKILLSDKPSKGIRLLVKTRLMDYIVPEIVESVDFNQYNPHHDKDVFSHMLCVVDKSPKIIENRLAAFFHDISKPNTFTVDDQGIGHFYNHHKKGSELAKIILKRLNSPKKLINTVSTLVKEHMIGHNEFSDKGLKRVINRVGRKEIYMLLDLMRADKICTNENVNTNDIDKLETRITEILNRKDPMSIKDLAIDGKDLIDLGIPQGKEIGRILKELFEMVMEDEKLNNKEKLLEIMKKRHKKS